MWIRSDKLNQNHRDDGPLLAAALICVGVLYAMFEPHVLPAPELGQAVEPPALPKLEQFSQLTEDLAIGTLTGKARRPMEYTLSSRDRLFGYNLHSVRYDLTDMEAELGCLATAIYYEARSETPSGGLAVAEVILNRVQDPFYPDSICGVVYQGALDGGNGGCQFTFTCDGSLLKEANVEIWRQSEELAAFAYVGFARGLTDRATHYHADYVSPVWAENLVRTVQIGRHVFYRRSG